MPNTDACNLLKNPPAGTHCKDGVTIYAGAIGNRKYMTTVACPNGGCGSDPDPKMFFGGLGVQSALYGTQTGITDPKNSLVMLFVDSKNGDELSAALATNPAFTAAKFCKDLRTGNYSDWYLPNIQELNLLHELSLIDSNAGFKMKSEPQTLTNSYWSSSSDSRNQAAMRQDFGIYVNPGKIAGVQGILRPGLNAGRTYSQFYVRCIRNHK